MAALEAVEPEESVARERRPWQAETSLSPEDMQRVLFDWQLVGVRLYEVSIERFEGTKAREAREVKPVLHSSVRVRMARQGLLGRLAVTIEYPSEQELDYRMRFSLEGFWRPKDSSVPLPTGSEVRGRRLGATILTLLWPYARESAHDLMRRMEVPIHPLPTIDKLEIQLVTEEATQPNEPSDYANVESAE